VLPAYSYRCVIREVAKNRAVLCYYAASSGNLLPTFRDNQSYQCLGIHKKAFSASTEFIEGRFWVVRSFNSVESASRVVASGWMEGSVVGSAVSTTVLYDTV
jgi:hypothetical protein